MRIADVRVAGKLRPRALIGVDLFGQPADWPAIVRHRRRRESVHARRSGAKFRRVVARPAVGHPADATATSFFPSKPLGAYGDGGALFTESDDRAALYRSLRTHGEGTTRYEVLRTGMNGRLDSIQAAVLLSKLTVFPEELVAREKIATFYDHRLGNAVDHSRPRSRQHRRLGYLFRPVTKWRRPRRGAGCAARGRRADGDLLSQAAASSAGLPGPSRWFRATGFRRSRGPHPGVADPSGLDEAAASRVCDAVIKRSPVGDDK